MKRIILILTSFLSTLVTLSAQEPRVCDYVSLKHALKGRECEVVKPASYYYNEDTVLVEHTKEEIGTEVLNGHGKAIDSLNIINYKNDTVYVYYEFDINGMSDLTEIKTGKGAFRIRAQANSELFFEPLEMLVVTEKELHDTIPTSIYPDIFEWNGLERLIKDSSTEHTADIWCSLTRLILNEYRLIHIDRWESRIFTGSLKRDAELSKKYGRDNNVPSEYKIVHIYDTISKKDNDEYVYIMYEDENRLSTRFKKGSKAFNWSYVDSHFLYEEPNTNSRKICELWNEVLIIYDIIGHWYYVKTTSDKEKDCYGWIKLQKEPAILLNADFYK